MADLAPMLGTEAGSPKCLYGATGVVQIPPALYGTTLRIAVQGASMRWGCLISPATPAPEPIAPFELSTWEEPSAKSGARLSPTDDCTFTVPTPGGEDVLWLLWGSDVDVVVLVHRVA